MMRAIAAATMIAAPVAVYAAAPVTPATFVMKAGASDLYETQSSKLVLATTKNDAVRRFADMMIQDHAKSTAEVKAAAAKSNVTPKPPVLDAMGQKNIAALKASTGAARDRLYVQQQKVAHQNALALHKAYAADGTAPALKSAAASIAPVVQHHIDMLASM